MRIAAPNYTQTPNDLFDHWLPLLGEGELKVLLVIMRKTFGWHKTHDAISVSQLTKLTGMHEDSVIKATKSLKNKGVISKEVVGKNGSQQTIYSLNVEEESKKSYPPEKNPPVKNPREKSEAQKKELILNKTDDDDARETADLSEIVESEKSIPSQIDYRSASGQERSVSKNEIFRRFTKKPFKTQTLIDAIKRLIERKDLIGDVFKYLETICAQIESNDRPIAKSDRKSKKNSTPSIPMPKENQEFEPGITWDEVLKLRKKQKETQNEI